MAKENVTPVRTSDPYGDEYPKSAIRYSKEGTQRKNVRNLPSIGDKKIMAKIKPREIKPN